MWYNELMKVQLLNKESLEEIKNLYSQIKQKTYTIWGENYPSEELICYDIERRGLYGVFDGDKLIAICFAGQRNEDGEENFTWKDRFNKRGTFARIGVAPEYQNKCVATRLLKFILNKLKEQGFDGVRITVGTQNLNAIKLYEKFNFINCGKVNKYDEEYYLFELRLIDK